MRLRHQSRFAGFGADAQRSPPPVAPPVQTQPDQWRDCPTPSANSRDNAPHHHQPLQTFHEATQQHGFTPRDPHDTFHWQNTTIGDSSHSLASGTQQTLPASGQATCIHQSSDDAAAYGDLAHYTSSRDILPYHGSFSLDPNVQHSLGNNEQCAALGDTSHQSADFAPPPSYSSLECINEFTQQVSHDNSNMPHNANIPTTQHANLAVPLVSSPVHEGQQQGNLDCPMAACERLSLLLQLPPPGIRQQPRPFCMEADFSGFRDLSHSKEHLRKAHGIIHPFCGCFLKSRKNVYTDHLKHGYSTCKVDLQPTAHPYAIRFEPAIDIITEKVRAAPVGRDNVREWSGLQENHWKELFIAMNPDYNFEQSDLITPCKPKKIRFVRTVY